MRGAARGKRYWKKPVVHGNLRCPAALHAQLTKAARRNKQSLHAEMLMRLNHKPETVEGMLKRFENEFIDQMAWARDELVRIVSLSLHEEIRVALVRVLRDLRNGDVPVLVNEELARINRQVLRDEVRAAFNDMKGKA